MAHKFSSSGHRPFGYQVGQMFGLFGAHGVNIVDFRGIDKGEKPDLVNLPDLGVENTEVLIGRQVDLVLGVTYS